MSSQERHALEQRPAAPDDDRVTVRSGGSVLAADAVARLERAGFSGVREVERVRNPPLRLVFGRRA